MLLPLAGPVAARTVRRYVAALKVATAPKEATCTAACVLDDDGGRLRRIVAEVAGVPRKVKYLVATLPYSNVYFARRIRSSGSSRCSTDRVGVHVFGGVVDRVVLDNTSLAVKAVLAGRDRLETEAFAGHC